MVYEMIYVWTSSNENFVWLDFILINIKYMFILVGECE
jgi:hypothetical protein